MKRIGVITLGLLCVCMFTFIVLLYKKNNKLQSEVNDLKKNENLVIEDNGFVKECTYTETFQFVDYYNYDGINKSDVDFYIILDKWLSKEPIKIERINSNIFDVEFVKGNNYEITYNIKVSYDGETNLFTENKEIIDIKSTLKEGMNQIQETCKF